LIRLILALILLGVTMWFLSRLGRLPAQERASFLRRGAIWGGVALVLVLVVTGRLPVIFAMVAGVLPWLQRAAMLRSAYNAIRGFAGLNRSGPSTIETRYLRVQLDPATGKLSGTVMDGPQIGRSLDEMERAELMALLHEVEVNDEDSRRLLESYIENRFSDWSSSEWDADKMVRTSEMNVEEAHEILGLKPGASQREIVEAHRRLMLKLHPDRGGVDWLATKINQAKDRLTRDQESG